MMLNILFFVLLFLVFGRAARIAFNMTWGAAKILIGLVFLPLTLIFAVVKGLLSIAFPILIIIGIISLFTISTEK